MLLQCLEDAREIFSSLKGSLVGVGMTAFSRIVPSYFFKGYHIIALRKTADLDMLRKRAEIFCLEEEIGETMKEPGVQSTRLLSDPLTRRYLRTLPDPKYLFIYQSYPELEELAREEKWILLASPSSLRTESGSRSFFKYLAARLNLNSVPGAIVPIQELWLRDYREWAMQLGPRLVVQLPEVRQGGGKGTFFVSTESEFQALLKLLKEGSWRGSKLETAAVHKYIEGIPASLALCITKEGIFHSGLQIQLLDLPYCNVPERGVFCGHSWGGSPWSDAVRDEALAQTRPIGEYMRQRGYRGILGIDLVIQRDRVYPMEMNPRLTGAFPMLSQLHMERGMVPMEAFHILEFMNKDYEADAHSLNEQYGERIMGSHMLLFLMGRGHELRRPYLRAGLYEMGGKGEDAGFVTPAIDYSDIRKDTQFIVIDGPPEGELGSQDPLYRLCRLLFRNSMTGDKSMERKPALQAAEWVYRRILLQESNG